MKRPFKIFPSVGYKNNQFQVISKVDNLTIDIFHQSKLIKSVLSKSGNPTVIMSLNATGRIIAKCDINGEVFEQEIEIKEALRLGSSEFKKAFLFDQTDYSFFLMKDRLLLYDEKKKALLAENHYSPTEIQNLNNSSYLFVTKIGQKSEGIINLGIYDTETFSMEGELLNSYQEIKILPKANKAWLYNKKKQSIHCFELISNLGRYFSELRKYEGFTDYYIDELLQRIFIHYDDNLKISDLNSIHQVLELPKLKKNAIDKWGNVFNLEKRRLTYALCFKEHSLTINLPFDINLHSDNFIHIGSDFKKDIQLTDFNQEVKRIQDEIMASIPNDKTFYDHLLPDSEQISESYSLHDLFLTEGGIFIHEKFIERKFSGIRFKKYQNNWIVKPLDLEKVQFSIHQCNTRNFEILIEKVQNLWVEKYHYPMLFIRDQEKIKVFSGTKAVTLKDVDSVQLFTINGFYYFLVKSQEKFFLYQTGSSIRLILAGITILNQGFIDVHKIIWYLKKDHENTTSGLFAFNLKNCSNIQFDQKSGLDSIFKNSLYFQFEEHFALSSNQVVFNPSTLEVWDSYVGKINAFSERLSKIVSYRDNRIYLSHFNNYKKKYEIVEIKIEHEKYKESYLSPDGHYLVLKDENDQYNWYDTEKNKVINFFSGKFLAFRNDGKLIVEKDSSRAVRIIDPLTFQDITPPNYHHYRFLSPDGKLYAQAAHNVKYINRLTNKEISQNEYLKFKKEFDEPSIFDPEKEKNKNEVERKRLQLFREFHDKLIDLEIDQPSKINSYRIIKVIKYTEIGIVGTDVSAEVQFPDDLLFYNYSAFSYDNKYFAYVGKPFSKGLINIFKLDFDEENNTLSIVGSYLSRLPSLASWVCGFSKTGYFATYDSNPNTFILFIDSELFNNKTSDSELRESLLRSKSHVYYSFESWNFIRGKNFLCFSPSGEYIALSEQGYEPLTLGGYGHQESSVVHIAKTASGEILSSFREHGSKLVNPEIKDTIFVAFSEDEKKLMTMSKDGVVIIRDINLRKTKSIDTGVMVSKEINNES